MMAMQCASVVCLLVVMSGLPASAQAAGPAGAASVNAPGLAVDVSLRPRLMRFGLTTEGLARLYDRFWDRHFLSRYRRTNPGPKMRDLDHQVAEQKQVLRRVARFDGRATSFDKVDFREEFEHRNRETMTSTRLVRQPSRGTAELATAFTRRFFFYRNGLWKVYDEYQLGETSPFGDNFDAAVRHVEAGLGKKVRRTRAPEGRWPSVVFDLGEQRLRLMQLPAGRLAVVRTDQALARQVLDSRSSSVDVPVEELEETVKAVLKEPEAEPPEH
jgi:hypothetical protein